MLRRILLLGATTPNKPVGVLELADPYLLSSTYLSKILNYLAKTGMIDPASSAILDTG